MGDLGLLLQRTLAGDMEAFGQVVMRFQDMALGYAYAVLGDFHAAEDATQDAFVTAHRKLNSLRRLERFPGWFRRIVLSRCREIRRGKKLATVSLSGPMPRASDRIDPSRITAEAEMREQVLDAIGSLPEPNRMATTLFYINGYSASQVAEFLEVPVGTVKRRLHNARSQLKARLLAMVEKGLKTKALPAGFAELVKRIVLFPKREPDIDISPLSPRAGKVEFREAAWFFITLEPGAEGITAWYDWPERQLASVGCARVVGRKKLAGKSCYRVRIPEFDARGAFTYDHDFFWAIQNRKVFLVGKSNFKPGDPKRRTLTMVDADWDEDRTGWPIDLPGKSQVTWRRTDRGEGVRFPRTQVPAGLWQVRIGRRSYHCLRTLTLGHYAGRRTGTGAAQLGHKYRMLADCYINMQGRTVLFRRYNGPAWSKDGSKPSSVAALRRKGCPALYYNGVELRLWYDCVPLHAV